MAPVRANTDRRSQEMQNGGDIDMDAVVLEEQLDDIDDIEFIETSPELLAISYYTNIQ
jgi:hypothetical protein